MNIKLLSFISLFLLLYGLLNYYIGLRGWQSLSSFTGILPAWGWIFFVIFMAMLFPIGRLSANILPREIVKIIIYAGSYWMAIIYYLLLALLTIDFLRLINHWTGIIPRYLYKSPAITGAVVILLVMSLIIYGTWNANHPIIKNYNVSINKKADNVGELRIAVVSDIHLGWIVGIDRLASMVKTINSLHPDLVLITGDTIDEGIDPSAEQNIPKIMGLLNPRFGTYAVLGNHEYISGNVQTTINYLNKAGIKVLRDQYVKVSGDFYIVGRDDRSCKRYLGKERSDLSKVMAGIDNDRLPVILLDHEPVDLNIAEKEGVDLQFSGHTHFGQFFPNNIITGLIYEDDWGYLKKGNYNIIVSCGFGTWGPPIRIASRPEILNVKVNFAR